MALYGSRTPKRHYAFGNTRMILGLDRGVLRKSKFQGRAKVTTVEHYIDKRGNKKYKGTSHLRSTENLVSIKIILF